MMGTRSLIRKTPFFGLTSPEKMINRIFNPISPPNDPSTSEYSQKMTLELQNSNFSPSRWLFNPAATVRKTVLSICILPRTTKIPNQSQTPPPSPQRTPPAPTSPPLSPQPPSILWPANRRWRPKRQRSKGKGRKRSHRPQSGHTVSAPQQSKQPSFRGVATRKEPCQLAPLLP
jgi:hypothetical protein